VNAGRQTPVPALAACSVLTAGFVVANLWFDRVIASAVLVAGFAALVLYLLSMWTLCRLRRREPELLAGYRAPLGGWLPLGVILLSVVALAVYPRLDETGVVVPVALGTYALAVAWFAVRGTRRATGENTATTARGPVADTPAGGRRLHRAAAVVLAVALGVIGVVAAAALGGPDLLGTPDDVSAAAVLGVLVAAILAVAAVELWQTRRRNP
jgi:hypothetical protein